MNTKIDRDPRLETVVTYFKKIDSRDPSYLDLFTGDVQFFFPKFGLARGKASLVTLGKRIGGLLNSIKHDIEIFNYIVSGNYVIVEGTESGVTQSGVHWPDGKTTQGRFCNVFEFDGSLICRVHIYVDPDFTSSDYDRIRVFSGSECPV
jgi:hypothetical protein